MLRWLVAALALAPLAAQHLPRPQIVNVDRQGMPFAPAFDLQADGSPRVVRAEYVRYFERLSTASVSRGVRTRTLILSGQNGVLLPSRRRFTATSLPATKSA